MCLSWLLASKTCRVGVLWSRGEGHTQLDGAHADKLTMSQFWGKITQGDTTASGSLPSLPSSRRKSYFRSYLHKTAASVLAGKHPRPCSGFKRCSSVRRRRRLFPRLLIFTPQTASLRSRPNLLHPSASPSSDL